MKDKRIACNPNAADLLDIAARQSGVTRAQLLDALAHYVTSINERDGSWEAETPFDIANYIGDQASADKWDASTLADYRERRVRALRARLESPE